MIDKENIESLAALADSEIIDLKIKNELESLIDSDSQVLTEFKIQLLIKNLVHEKVGFITTPEMLKRRIKRKLLSEVKYPAGKIIPPIFSQPYISFATAAIIILALILIIFNRPSISDVYNFALEQQGSDNMFVQAQKNYHLIISEELEPQIISGNPSEVKKYFEQNKISYSVFIPVSDRLNLIGAAISKSNTKKLANLFYSNDENKFVYLYQADEKTILDGMDVTLTEDLLKYLNEGHCYTYSGNNINTLLMKAENNICVVVSDIKQAELTELFCVIK